jgi:hypothetical protein
MLDNPKTGIDMLKKGLKQCHLVNLAKFNFYQPNVSYIYERPAILIEVPQIWFIQGYI